MNKNVYYNKIGIYEDDGNVLNAEVYINEESYCEGIISVNNTYNLIVGVFKKYDYFDLYVINESGEIVRYKAKKNLFQYSGHSFKLNGGVEKNINAQITELAVDPKDCYDNPRDLFIEKLNDFKDKFLDNRVSRNAYEQIKEKIYANFNQHRTLKWKLFPLSK